MAFALMQLDGQAAAAVTKSTTDPYPARGFEQEASGE